MSNIQDEIRAVESKVADLRMKLQIEESVLKRLKAVYTPIQQPQQSNQGLLTIPSGTIIDNLVEVLSASNGPMTSKQLAIAVKEKGATTTAKGGFSAAIASALTRREDLFVRIKRGVYDLKNKHIKPE